MSNDLQYAVKVHYADSVQENLEKELTAMELAEMIDIPNGTTKNLPYIKMRSTGDYTKYTNQTITDITTANDQIVINTTPMVNFALDDIDVAEDYINVKPEVISDATYAIKSRIDGEFFAQILNAKWKYDNNGFGRNTGTLTPVALVTGGSQNITTVFGNAKAGLTQTGCNGSKLALVVDSFTTVALQTLGLEAGFNVADVSYTRGFQGMFAGMSTYETSFLTSSVILDIATQVTEGDYVDIQGVRFTFNATPSGAGSVDIGGDVDTSAANLVACLNGTGTAGTTYIELDADDRARLEGVTAVATAGSDIVTFTSKRGALMAVSSMTNASNDFRAQTLNACIMEKGAIKMAIRNSVKVENAREPLKLVTNWFIYARYGLKVTTRSAERMCRVALQSAAAEA